MAISRGRVMSLNWDNTTCYKVSRVDPWSLLGMALTWISVLCLPFYRQFSTWDWVHPLPHWFSLSTCSGRELCGYMAQVSCGPAMSKHKGARSTDTIQWPGFILSWSTAGLRTPTGRDVACLNAGSLTPIPWDFILGWIFSSAGLRTHILFIISLHLALTAEYILYRWTFINHCPLILQFFSQDL